MRISFAILLIVTILLPSGCNSDLRCRRETALLRAEYLDLEDKYYSLLAQSEGGITQGSTIIDNSVSMASGYENAVVLDSGLPVGSGVIVDQGAMSQNSATPEITYYDQTPGYQNSGQVIGTAVAPGMTYGGVIDSAPVATPTLAAPLINDQSNESGRSTESLPVPSGIDSDGNRGLRDSLFDETEPLPSIESPSKESVIDEFDGISILDPSAPRLEAEFAASSKTIGQVSKVQINSSVSRGENTDGIAGDDELRLLVQPMTASGDVIEQAGNLTISVVDPAAEQGQQQVGYWEFVRSETELFFARDEFDNRGLLLKLPWTNDPPANANLNVYVRYETATGDVIETTGDVTIDPPGLSLDNIAIETFETPSSSSGDWYKGQVRQRRSRDASPQTSSIKTRPIRSTQPSQQSDDYYRRPAWKPVR